MKNYRRRIKFLAAWMLILLQIFALAGCRGITESGDKTGSAGETESSELTGGQSGDILQVQVLKIGKADAILLFCGGRTMVIDC